MGLSDLVRIRGQQRTAAKVTRSLRKAHVEDPAMLGQVDDMDAAVRTVLPPPFRQGQLVELTFPDALGSFTLDVAHGLGAYPEGFIPAGLSAAATVFLVPRASLPAGYDQSNHARFTASAAVTFRAWVWR